MKFDDLDRKTRVFETAADLCVLPSMFIVARLDGRSCTPLTKDVCQFEAPFDVRFRDLMVATAESLMACGFRVLLAGEASAQFSLKPGVCGSSSEVYARSNSMISASSSA